MSEDFSGQLRSPGGFIFGVVGWTWGEQRPKSITFFLDNTAKVSDQHGRPIRGGVYNNKEILFAQGPPEQDDALQSLNKESSSITSRTKLATHAQIVKYLLDDLRIDWRTLTCAGWPQLPYAQLKELPVPPPTPIEELRKIKDNNLRKDALRIRREFDERMIKELSGQED